MFRVDDWTQDITIKGSIGTELPGASPVGPREEARGPASTRVSGERATEGHEAGAGDRVRDPNGSGTDRSPVAVPAASNATQHRLPAPTPVTISPGAPAAPAPLAAAKIAAHETIVAGLEAVAATEVARTRAVARVVGVTLAPAFDSDAFAIGASRLEPVIEVLHL